MVYIAPEFSGRWNHGWGRRGWDGWGGGWGGRGWGRGYTTYGVQQPIYVPQPVYVTTPTPAPPPQPTIVVNAKKDDGLTGGQTAAVVVGSVIGGVALIAIIIAMVALSRQR